jgi:hypothetical protein
MFHIIAKLLLIDQKILGASFNIRQMNRSVALVVPHFIDFTRHLCATDL